MPSTPSLESDQQKRLVRRRWHYALIVLVATVLNLVRLIEAKPLQSANDRSRWTTVWSLVERGTYQIDEIRQRPGWDTIDLVKHEGHFYSSKPPLLSTLVAGLYWGGKHTLRWTLDDHLLPTTRLLLAVVNLLPMTIALVLLALLIDRSATSDFTRHFLVIAAATATLLQPFLVVLNNHTPGAWGCVFALYPLVQILIEKRDRGWLFAMAGFWAAWTCCVELPAALFGAAVFFLLAQKDWRRTRYWFVPAAIVPLAAFFFTNYVATGGWKPFYLFYGTDKYVFFDDGVPSYWMFPRGIDRAKDSTLTYLLHCTIGHHGVWSLTPIYLLTLGSWLSLRTWKTSSLRVIHALGLLMTVALFCFFLTKTDNYNYGGVSVALRWLLWLTPFWLLAIVPVLDDWRPAFWGRTLCALLLAVSVFSAWYPLGGPWRQPWLFDLMTLAGWIDYSDPVRDESPPFHAWIRQLPPTDSADALPDYWIEFEGVDADGTLRRLRLADAGGETVDGRDVRRVAVTRSSVSINGPELSTDEQTMAIDVGRFAEGLPVEELVVWPPAMSDKDRSAVVRFLRGLPEPRPYAVGRIRYLDSPLREEKFRCRHAASRVLYDAAGPADANAPAGPTIHRRDQWMTDDVPFGVLMFEASIQDARTPGTLTRQRMRAVRAGRVRPFDPARLRQALSPQPL